MVSLVLDHQIQIVSDRYLVPDETNVPIGESQAVAGTACDFRQLRRLGDAFEELPNGFEHYYVFAESAETWEEGEAGEEPRSPSDRARLRWGR